MSSIIEKISSVRAWYSECFSELATEREPKLIQTTSIQMMFKATLFVTLPVTVF